MRVCVHVCAFLYRVLQTLAERMAEFMHLYTEYWYVRPFGSSIMIAGVDLETKEHELYMAEPTGDVNVRQCAVLRTTTANSAAS
jgi:20S proteasome alpha/beta subunit